MFNHPWNRGHAQYASLHSVYLLQMYLYSKFEGSFPLGNLETKLSIAGEYSFREIFVMAQYASLLSVDFPQMYLRSKFQDYPC